MSLVIVPDVLHDAIHKAIDKKVKDCPDAERERENIYHVLLEYFNEQGRIPEFNIVRRKTNDTQGTE